jgi:N-acyl-D-amino-acid deacylase
MVLADGPASTVERIRTAAARTLPSIEAGSKGSAEQRTCFTCHSQALPILALSEAKRHGLAIDEENYQRQLQHTYDHLQRGLEHYREVKGQGGGVLTAGFALWALEAGRWKREETIEAVTHYLVEYQLDRGHWMHRGSRPPSSGSDFTATYVALRGLQSFGSPSQAKKIADRQAVVARWLFEQSPEDTEDSVFRLKLLSSLEADVALIENAACELIRRQRDDGGWSQDDDMESDAYATATVLDALLRDRKLNVEHISVRHGIAYLLESQLPDGTWRVTSRAKPFQEYFESGFPHGSDQFISIAATSWSALALLATLPEPN